MDVKDYMSKREIANLFECLMTGLLYHRPEDYIEYLIECLNKIKNVGIDAVRWDMFLEAKRAKTPLPPIGSRENGSRSNSDLNTATPLPPIGTTSPGKDDRILPANVPLILVNGGPGSGKDSFCDLLTKRFSGLIHISTSTLLREELSHSHKDAMDSGELLPDEVVLPVLSEAMKTLVSSSAPGVLLTGYPRSVAQANQLQTQIGGVRQLLLIDYEEEDLKQTLERRCKEGGRADDEALPSSRRLKHFKEETLPVCKYYEDQDKLMLIEGSRDRTEILQMMTNVLELQFGRAAEVEVKFAAPRPPSVPRPGYSRPATFIQPTVPEDVYEEHGGIRIITMEPTIKDQGRKQLAPKCPIIAVLGGPGSGRSTQTEAISKSCEGYVSVNFEQCSNDPQELFSKIENEQEHAKGFILDGFPCSETTLSEFNDKIGGMDLVILIDCFEDLLRKRCMTQTPASSDMENEIAKFKESGLSVVRHYDLQGQLSVVLGDQDVECVTKEIIDIINTKIGQKEGAEETAAPAEESEPTAAEAPEEPTETKTETEEVAEVTPTEDDATAEALKSIKVVFVIGGPGSGKGTQCEKILQDYNVGHVSTGDLMRAEVESGSELGQELKTTMEKGELVTLDTVLKLLKASLVKMSADKKCFLIDGYPREKEQGVRFENEVTECACCLFFDVDQEVMVQRLLKRGETSGRVDDNEETIRKRLQTFVDNTDPILAYFDEKKKLNKIVASGTVDEIYSKVQEALDNAHVERKSA